MTEKINIAELLKDCPKGIELYSPLFGELKFYSISHTLILCQDVYCEIKAFDFNGKYNSKYHNAECMLFPSKYVRTWEGFVPSWKFKDGDIISDDNIVAIFYKLGTPRHCISSNIVYYHCYYNQKYCEFRKGLDYGIGYSTKFKHATEEEKEKLFQAIKDNGYNWNEEKKVLEKLIEPIFIEPIFKAGDKISLECEDVYWDIKTIDGDWYICTNGAKIHIGEQHHYKLVPIEPNFKKGDKVRTKNGVSEPRIIKDVCDTFYTLVSTGKIDFTDQDNWELVPNKFDITTLKPFDSRVLVRDDSCCEWEADIFGRYSDGYYITIGGAWEHCIPYEGNEHLLGTTNDCDEFYKTW